jgi:DnaJ domain
MNLLRVTHLSRYRPNWDIELGEDGCFMRFTGTPSDFDWMRYELKSYGRAYARWIPDYQWLDEKEGAWWVDDEVLMDVAEHFINLYEATQGLSSSDTHQWIEKREPRKPHARRESPSQAPLIPLHLRPDYKLLCLPSTATAQEVKASYKSLAKRYHPDTGGSHERFIALQRAYAHVLQWAERIAV